MYLDGCDNLSVNQGLIAKNAHSRGILLSRPSSSHCLFELPNSALI